MLSTNVGFFSLYLPFIRAKDSGCKSGHQIVSQADQHDGAGKSSEHRWIQIINQPWEEDDKADGKEFLKQSKYSI